MRRSPLLTEMRALNGLVAGLVLVAAFSFSSGPAAAQSPRCAPSRSGFAGEPDFSQTEKRSLEAGELVVRRANKRQGDWKLIGGTSWQLIKAPASLVWDTVIDPAHYRRILPQVMEVRLVKQQDERLNLFIRHGNDLLNMCYYLDMDIDPDRREVSFRVDPRRSCEVKAGWGFYLIRPYGKDRTVLVYGIMADLGDGIIPSLLRERIHEWMLKVPWMVKRIVESRGSKRP